MPEMRLHHAAGKRSTWVLWTLEEIGAPYEIAVLGFSIVAGPGARSWLPLRRLEKSGAEAAAGVDGDAETAAGSCLRKRGGLRLRLLDRPGS
jgi:hypothetical protein